MSMSFACCASLADQSQGRLARWYTIEDGFLPPYLMRLLRSEGAKAVVADDVRSPEALELGAISTGLLGKRHEVLDSLKVSIMIGSDIGDEVGGLAWPHEAGADRLWGVRS